MGNALLPEYACLPVVFFFPTWLPVLRMPSITGPAPCACLSVYAYCTLRQLAYFPPALPPCWCGNIPVACHLPLPSHASVHTPHSLGIPTPLQSGTLLCPTLTYGVSARTGYPSVVFTYQTPSSGIENDLGYIPYRRITWGMFRCAARCI